MRRDSILEKTFDRDLFRISISVWIEFLSKIIEQKKGLTTTRDNRSLIKSIRVLKIYSQITLSFFLPTLSLSLFLAYARPSFHFSLRINRLDQHSLDPSQIKLLPDSFDRKKWNNQNEFLSTVTVINIVSPSLSWYIHIPFALLIAVTSFFFLFRTTVDETFVLSFGLCVCVNVLDSLRRKIDSFVSFRFFFVSRVWTKFIVK